MMRKFYIMFMINKNNVCIRRVQSSDKEFWFSLDKHLSADEFNNKVLNGQGYVLLLNDHPIGLLRYNLFWDNTPFCNLLFIAQEYQQKGYGKALMTVWENEMQSLGYDWILLSTREDESSQHFYRKLGYENCGELSVPNQPKELFFSKTLKA